MKVKQSILQIEGMHCAACVARVERALKKVAGVENVNVNFALHSATIDGTEIENDTLIAAVEKAGYGAHEIADLPATEGPKSMDFWISLTLSVPLAALSMLWHDRPVIWNWVLFGLATPVVFYCGRGFLIRGWKAAVTGSSTMDTLVALGSLAAWGYSLWGLLSEPPHHHSSDRIYFEVGAVVITLVLLGKQLEARASARMESSIQALVRLAPSIATVIIDGKQVDKSVASLVSGDIILLRPGERVSVDGTVVEGSSEIDESMLTGEPMPTTKRTGDTIHAGTLNRVGSLIYRAEKVGRETLLSQIAQAVAKAQSSKAPMQKLADRISAFFVPVVLLIAVVALVVNGLLAPGWEHGLSRAVAVLLIACPCSLGLATPTALIVAMGKGAELGILIKDGDTLQKLARVGRVIFDKTGTLTVGRPRLLAMQTAHGVDQGLALRVAASLEFPSEHPIGKSITAAVPDQDRWSVQNFKALEGAGVEGEVEGNHFQILKLEPDQLLPKELASSRDQMLSQGRTICGLWVDGRCMMLFGLGDEPAQHAAMAIEQLIQMNLCTEMLTGDSLAAAKHIAQFVGIEQITAGVHPVEKADFVRKRQESERVAMVGDGINDAPALAEAEVGIAMGQGSDVALNASGVTLLRSDLRGVPQAIRLARQTMRVIYWNLFWALGYNVLMIPLAITGILNPMLASAAMALSSVSVVLHSLSLRRFR